MLNSPTSYVVIQNVLTPEECQDIIDYGLEHGSNVEGKIGGSMDKEEDKLTLDKKVRDTNLYFFSHQETYQKIMPNLSDVNRDSGWQFNLSQIEPLQLSIYNKDAHYDWHIDSRPFPYSDNHGPFSGMVRKLSFSIMLNNEDEYEGGDFEIEDQLPGSETRSHKIKDLNHGAILVFPSYTPHKVHPVTKGKRYSLVGWVCGPAWR